MKLLELGRKTAEEIRPDGWMPGKKAAKKIRRAMEQIETVCAAMEGKSEQRDFSDRAVVRDHLWLISEEGRCAEVCFRAGKIRASEGEPYLFRVITPLLEQGELLSKKGLSEFLSGMGERDGLTEEELSLAVPALKGVICLGIAGCLAERGRGELENLVSDLAFLSSVDLSRVLEGASVVGRILAEDPAGVYPVMDEESRRRYRERVCRLARKEEMTERAAAEKVLSLARESEGTARHVGWYLFERPLGREKKKVPEIGYPAWVILPALGLSVLMGAALKNPGLALLALLPLSEITKRVTDRVIMARTEPRPVFKMELPKGIPPEGRTLCVITGLLTGPDSGAEYAGLLERYRLTNRDSGAELRFGLLADLPDSKDPVGEEKREWLRKAEKAFEGLNERYGGGFFLLFREPEFLPGEGRYMGWERKRGALLELGHMLRGLPSGTEVKAGDTRELAGTQYIITLDSDTALNVGAAGKLVGAMLHPLNRPVTDMEKRIVVRGHGLLQPRVSVDVKSAVRTRFSQVYAGQGGTDPYIGRWGEIYHDVFDRGSYTGKGIFHVDTFLFCLDGRFPRNRVLSHDLLEGAYLRAGLTDTQLTDGHPCRVSSYFSRLHRWTRGDWQILPWLGKRVKREDGSREDNPLSAIDRWKILDNLRRSLVPAAELALLLAWICLPGSRWRWGGIVALAALWGDLLPTGRTVFRRFCSPVLMGAARKVALALSRVVFLPLQAWVCASAVCTALWRSLVTKKNLLEWVTSDVSEKRKGSIAGSIAMHWPAEAAGAAALVLGRTMAGRILGVLLLLAPLTDWWMSRPIERRERIGPDEREFLLEQAGMIWKYFQDQVKKEENWLPPDHVQIDPPMGADRRTSPTNIGMALLSCVAAVDLELAGRKEAAELIGHIIGSVEKLEKWKGNLYNWYSTTSGMPLQPRYVSSVDSGNLRGCLLALSEALREWGEEELSGRAATLADEMKLTPLYDRERKLFSVGFNTEKGELNRSCYDLLASEARLTSFLAVALGEVEPEHWNRLGRGLTGEKGYCGLISWTGSVFEYFMPELLMESPDGSLMGESLRYCLREQKRQGRKQGTPWGSSESCYHCLAWGEYRYGAHGTERLALKPGMDREKVRAPYASFLTLCLEPGEAIENLRRLKELGGCGIYGFCEAVDFTGARLEKGESRAAVGTFMVHHLGMSMLAIDNALNDRIMIRRFRRNPAIRAYRELLEEKIPADGCGRRKKAQGNPEPILGRPGPNVKDSSRD